MDWQFYIALAIVLVTLAVFLLKVARPKLPGGTCGHHCGCAKRAPAPPPDKQSGQSPRER